jgi:UDP-glucose 4-epimerase
MIAPEKYAANNISGSLNIISECVAHGVKQFILSSSAAVYGEPSYLPIDELHPCHPENYYGYTKLAIEENLAWFSKLKAPNMSRSVLQCAGNIVTQVDRLERTPQYDPRGHETASASEPNIQIFGADSPTYDGPVGTG